MDQPVYAAGFDWRSAFPSHLDAEVEQVASRIPPSDFRPSHFFEAAVDGRLLTIPYRMYNPEITVSANVGGPESAIQHCIYTRHKDGHIREKSLRQLLQVHEDWMYPFVIRLLGEYVMQIHKVLLENPWLLRSAQYTRYTDQNPELVRRTKSQIISYHDCYYYNVPLESYPAYQAADLLGWWTSAELRGLRHKGQIRHR